MVYKEIVERSGAPLRRDVRVRRDQSVAVLLFRSPINKVYNAPSIHYWHDFRMDLSRRVSVYIHI